nr:hypothetical protein Itr_chr01CG06410 [Ipomoea trifida]
MLCEACALTTVTIEPNHATMDLISNSDTLEEKLRKLEGSKGGAGRLRGDTDLFLRGEARAMFMLEEEGRVSGVSSEKWRVVALLKTRGLVEGVEAKCENPRLLLEGAWLAVVGGGVVGMSTVLAEGIAVCDKGLGMRRVS